MEIFKEYLDTIENEQNRVKMTELLSWVHQEYPQLEMKIAWNQPMFTDHGTFILGFSVSKKHIAVSPEKAGMIHFSEDIKKSGYNQTMMLMQIPWNSPIDYELLKKMIDYNILDKIDCNTFWRK